ncbi:unnamed protein product [Paramecium sonneborni]|uniref:Uncharacterized protein n=1 Tax=Paramecium sonneborni TaxID=65129 RepID=A0A8S1NA49_9CILI|nr:unnamed protein product [Paramecium sonneborni]
MIEEEPQQSDQTKVLQLIHTNTKITKQQASQMNLMKLVKQCQLQFQIEQNFRECSQYLSELAIIYLKQHQYLKKDIEILQNSLIDQFDEQQQKKQNKKKTIDKDKIKQMKEKDSFDNEPQFSFKENPKNIIAAEKLQLVEQQKSSMNMQQLLKRNNNQQTEYEIDSIVKDLSQIYKCSLSDILNKKKQELRFKRNSNNIDQSKQQLVYNFNNQEQEIKEDDYNLVEEVSQTENPIIEYPEISQKQNTSKIVKKQNKKNYNKDNKEIEKRNRKSKMSLLKKTPELDSKIKEDTDEVFKNNLKTFMRHKEKINELSLEINYLQLEPEFWRHEDELIGLINKISFCQDSHQNRNIQNENNILIFDNLTTDLDHKKVVAQNFGENSQIKQSISEFANLDFSQTPQKLNKKEDNSQIYLNLIEDLHIAYGKNSTLSSNKFFEICEKYQSNKPKAFYDLLILSRVGMVQIKNTQNQQFFSKIQIII